jgi:hypothetical protein
LQGNGGIGERRMYEGYRGIISRFQMHYYYSYKTPFQSKEEEEEDEGRKMKRKKEVAIRWRRM